MHDDERGLEVSPCGFLQDQLIEGQIRHRLSQPVILLLKPLQFLQLIYAHSAILLTPAVIGLFNNSDLSDRIVYECFMDSNTEKAPQLSLVRRPSFAVSKCTTGDHYD